MGTAKHIIEKFGGLTAMAKALGHKHVSTVQGWKVKDRIPHWRIPEIESAAKKAGIDVSELSAPTE